MERLCPELVTKKDKAIAKELDGIEPLFDFERGCHLKIYSKKPLSISDEEISQARAFKQRVQLQKRLCEMLLQINESLEFSLKWVLRNYQEFNLEPFPILN